jgi:TonB family protein
MKTINLFLFVFSLALYCKAQNTPADSIPVVYSYIEQLPTFPGSIGNYLKDNLKYPPEAKRLGIQGRVTVRFFIDTAGYTDSAYVIKSLYPDLDTEAVEVVSNMPRWEPGYQNGKLCKVYYSLPIVFRLNDQPLPKEEKSADEIERENYVRDSLANNYSPQPAFDWQKFLSQCTDPFTNFQTVYVNFLIDKTGKVSQYTIQRSENDLLNEKALKIAKKIARKRWIQGKRNGKFSSFYCVLPIY